MTTQPNHVAYYPNPAQERWLRAMRPGGRMFWRSGVGTGKTNIVTFTAQRLAHLNPGVPGLVVSHNLVHVEQQIITPLKQLLLQAGTYHSINGRLRTLYLNTGATVQWAGAHKPDSLDGKDVGWGLGDEPRHWPEESYNTFVSRIRQVCPYPFEGLLSTPERNWLERRLKDNPDFTEIVAKTLENMANLQPDYYAKLARSLSPELYESYVNGEWMHLGGGVFPEFDSDKHADDTGIWVPGHPVDIALDPAAAKSAALFFQHLPWCQQHQVKHCVHVLDEMMLDDVPTLWMPERWKALYYRRAWGEDGEVYIDSAGTARSEVDHRSSVAELRKAGYRCHYTTDPAKRAIMAGTNAIRGKLKPYEGAVSLHFHPRLLDDPTERGIIRSLQESRRHESTGKKSDGTPIKCGKLDHARDALRYAVVNLCPLPATSTVTGAT